MEAESSSKSTPRGRLARLRWAVHLAIIGSGAAAGFAAGVGIYTFHYAKGASYLTNDPKACANCHIMQEQYSAWESSSHRSVATCNDCHAPHSLIPKYFVKASNGFWHSYAFTTGRFHEPIQITKGNLRVTENACRHCHASVVHAMDTKRQNGDISCVHCHRNVGHLH